jgi:hypothetical protein
VAPIHGSGGRNTTITKGLAVVNSDPMPVCKCGHRAWTHGNQSGFPSPNDPCHAALVIEEIDINKECECTSYRRADDDESN